MPLRGLLDGIAADIPPPARSSHHPALKSAKNNEMSCGESKNGMSPQDDFYSGLFLMFHEVLLFAIG